MPNASDGNVCTSTPGLLDTDFVYDTRGRLTDVTVGTRTTSFAYDTNGYLDLMTTPDSRTFDYTYDVMGRLTGELRPDGASVSYSYDNNGNMTVLVNPNLVGPNLGAYQKIPVRDKFHWLQMPMEFYHKAKLDRAKSIREKINRGEL